MVIDYEAGCGIIIKVYWQLPRIFGKVGENTAKKIFGVFSLALAIILTCEPWRLLTNSTRNAATTPVGRDSECLLSIYRGLCFGLKTRKVCEADQNPSDAATKPVWDPLFFDNASPV